MPDDPFDNFQQKKNRILRCGGAVTIGADIARMSDADAAMMLEMAEKVLTEPSTAEDLRLSPLLAYTVKRDVRKLSFLYVSDSLLKVSLFPLRNYPMGVIMSKRLKCTLCSM